MILEPEISNFITKDGFMTEEFFAWVVGVSAAVNNLEPLTGSGSPEASIAASPGRWYVDTSAGAGTGVYFKESGDGDIGWELR
jgi:hypothetical protein